MSKTYAERLRDPRWQRRRLEILDRAGFACQSCDSTEKTLHVHHLLYRKGAMPWEYADHELKALCEDCHAEDHKIRASIQSQMAAMDSWELHQLLGYTLSFLVNRAWESEDASALPALVLQNAEQAAGLADGLRIEHPFSEALNTPEPFSMLQLMEMEAAATRRSIDRSRDAAHPLDQA